MSARHVTFTHLPDMPTPPGSPTDKRGFGGGWTRTGWLAVTLVVLAQVLGTPGEGVAAASWPGGDPTPTERASDSAPAGTAELTEDAASSPGQQSADPGDPFTRGSELRELARTLRIDGNPVEALEPAMEAEALLSQALRLARTADDSLAVTLELAEARNQLGLNLWILSRFQEAVQSFEGARMLWLPLNHTEGLGRVHNNLGVVYFQWGNYDLALESFLEALPYREAQADTAGMARVLSNIGLVRLDWRQFDEAEEALERAVALADATGEPGVRAYAWQTLASLHLDRGDLDAADEAYRLSTSLAPPGAVTQGSVGLAQVYGARGDYATAITLLREAVEESRRTRQPRIEARALRHLGEVHFTAGDLDQADTFLREALTVAKAQELRPIQVSILENMAEVHEARGDPEAALAALRRHQAVRDSLFSQGTGQRLASAEARLEADRRTRENLELRMVQAYQEEQIARGRLVQLLGTALLLTLLALMLVLAHFNRRGRERQEALTEANAKLETANQELTLALSENRTLQGLIPICSSCRKVRDDKGYWEALETYVSERSEANFSHSICADCGPRMYGEYWSDEEASAAPTR